MLSFLGVEDVIIFHDVNVMITINDNINDNTKYVKIFGALPGTLFIYFCNCLSTVLIQYSSLVMG